MQQQPDLFKALIAIIPVAVIFVAMLAFKLSSWKAGGLAFITAGLLAFFVWKLDVLHIAQAAGEGALTGLLPISWVIFTAMLLYNLSVKCGAMDTIRATLTRYAPDEASLVLLIAFGFGSFLESVSGFGTPVVVPAAILILFGFEPLRAAVICLAANTVAVAFGVVGIPVITLANVTGLPVGQLSVYISLQLFIFSLLLPCLLVFMTVKSIRAMKPHLPLCLISGFTFAAVQTLIAWLLGPELPAIIASLCAMLVIMVWQSRKRKNNANKEKTTASQWLKPWSAYILILVIVICTRLIPGLAFLSKGAFLLSIPVYEGQAPFTSALLTNPGTIILICAIVFSFVYKISAKDFFNTMGKTLKQVKNAVLTVLLIVALAKVLSHSGMIDDIALGIAAISGSLFPLISPVIGCIGTFVTGSDTSSNILFGQLQKQTALLIGTDPVWLSAANTAGATIGKMISPLSIALAAVATGVKGSESSILKITLKYAAALIAIMAVLMLATSFLFQ